MTHMPWTARAARASNLSGCDRALRRGLGTPVFNEDTPPAGGVTEIEAWAREVQRRNGLIVAACDAARVKGDTYFYHPVTGKVSDVAFYLTAAKHRLSVAADYLNSDRS